MKLTMEIILDNYDSDDEVSEELKEEIKRRIDEGCTITGQIGIGFDKTINFMSVDGSVEVKE